MISAAPLEARHASAGGAWLNRVPAAWRAGLARLVAAWALLLAITAGDWAAMAHQWWNSSTYTHVLLVPAILIWLVVQRAPALARLTPRGWWPGLILLAGTLALWLCGRLAGVAEVSQAGAVGALVAAVVLLLGPRIAAGLTFPLCYMAFLVPVGDEMIPALQNVTAALTVLFVHWSHVRASIDGVFINTPAGLFQVAEACSGVKFLVAMIAFGVLAANLCFVSWWRRAVFMAACVVVPVIANGVRAWGTVYVAQFKGAAYAGGVDHIIYGWIFFAIVIAAIIGGGWRWFDRPVTSPMIDVGRLLANPVLTRLERMSVPPWLGFFGLAALAVLACGWANAADSLAAPMPAHIDLPPVAGWHRVDYAPRHWWQPRAGGASHRLLGSYADNAGHEVDVFYALYASQGAGRKAGGTDEGAFGGGSGWAWQAPGPAMTDALSQRLLTRGPDGAPLARLAATTYRTGALTTGSNMALRLANFEDKVLLRPRATELLILSAEERPGQPAAASIVAFRRAIGPLGSWMDGAALQR